MHVHSFIQPMENRQRVTKLDSRFGVVDHPAGIRLDTRIPGTAAEIPRRRGALGAAKGKLPTSM